MNLLEESECLSQKAQATVAFELKEEGYRLKDILVVIGISETTYHYHIKRWNKIDQNLLLKETIPSCFITSKSDMDPSKLRKS